MVRNRLREPTPRPRSHSWQQNRSLVPGPACPAPHQLTSNPSQLGAGAPGELGAVDSGSPIQAMPLSHQGSSERGQI